MAQLETVMGCVAYALGCFPSGAEIRRAKIELLDVTPESVYMVIKSTEFLLSYMSEREIALYRRQICACMLSAVSYRIALPVKEYNALGYFLCPRCHAPFEREYQKYCDRCGQHLRW